MAHGDAVNVTGRMQQAITCIGETLCMEHACLLKARKLARWFAPARMTRQLAVCSALQLAAGTSDAMLHGLVTLQQRKASANTIEQLLSAYSFADHQEPCVHLNAYTHGRSLQLLDCELM